jgi:proline iminopeptidase
MIDVDGAMLEVFLGGAGEPVVCQSHPFAPRSAELEYGQTSGGWESGMGRLVGVNPRGVGNSSSKTPGDFTFRRHVDDLEVVRERLGIDRWVVWGESAGGAVALLYALAYPQAISGLVAVAMGPSGRRVVEDEHSAVSPRHPQFEQDLTRLRAPLGRHPTIIGSYGSLGSSAEWLHLRDDQWALTDDNQPIVMWVGAERMEAACEEFVSAFDVEDRLGEIEVPTLIVACRRDPVIPISHCERLRTGIVHAEYEVMEESGHVPEPASADGASYRAAVRGFLARIPSMPATGSA